MYVRPELIIRHPILTTATQVLRNRERVYATDSERVREAREAREFAKITAIVDLITGDFDHDQLRELVERLSAALTEHESDGSHKRASNPFTVE
ncbi:hypothetical protein NGM33_09235 [Nocardiopsis dassonvillei]|uniref:hypothetical protein n=1 Tax=Nocardiopsis dassonvillei TaxID=2014 RepID=UPI0020A2AC25|nr:hypothetical protein [Nocardiopsis dassonvillei]MCP3013517.1 hypothetical protein [Nocardiopsis dassonvillei]